MADLGFVWDISHLADDGLDLGFSPCLCVARERPVLTPTDRHLDDEVICAVADRGGVIGLVLYNGFLEPRWIGARHAPRTPGEARAAVPTEGREGVLSTNWLNFLLASLPGTS
jgi:microsomal dipeptidase-like Zn-dependent dipeptidase